jgi:hypothetical protein
VQASSWWERYIARGIARNALSFGGDANRARCTKRLEILRKVCQMLPCTHFANFVIVDVTKSLMNELRARILGGKTCDDGLEIFLELNV